MPVVTVAEILMKRKRLRLQQNEAARIAGLNGGTLIDIELGRVSVEDRDLERINRAYDTWASKNMESPLGTMAASKQKREEVMA